MSTESGVRDCTSLDAVTRRAARLWPDRIALIDGDDVVTHRQLDAAVDSLAAQLIRAGLTPGKRCAVAMDHSWLTVAGLLAVGRAGLVVLPLNIRLSSDELGDQIARSRVEALLVSPGQLTRLEGTLDLPALTSVGLVGVGGPPLEATGARVGGHEVRLLDAALEHRAVELELSADALGSLWFTGGSTGVPKLVMHRRGAPVPAIDSWISRLNLTEHDRGFALNYYHISTMSNTAAVLAAGGSVILIPEFRVPTILSLVQRHRATLLITLALFPNMLVRDPSIAERFDLSSLRLILGGGAPTETSTFRTAMDMLPGVMWGQAWAQTELCSGGAAIIGAEFRDHIASVGRPLACP